MVVVNMLQRLMGRTKQVSSTYKVCLVHGAHSAMLVSGADRVAVTVPSSLSCCTLLLSARVAHLPSESCLMFFPGHLQRHLLVNSVYAHSCLSAIRKKEVGYGSKLWRGGKWDKVFHVDQVSSSKWSVSDPQRSSCSISAGPALIPPGKIDKRGGSILCFAFAWRFCSASLSPAPLSTHTPPGGFWMAFPVLFQWTLPFKCNNPREQCMHHAELLQSECTPADEVPEHKLHPACSLHISSQASLPPQLTTSLTSCTINGFCPFYYTLDKWNHTVCSLLSLVSFASYSICEAWCCWQW